MRSSRTKVAMGASTAAVSAAVLLASAAPAIAGAQSYTVYAGGFCDDMYFYAGGSGFASRIALQVTQSLYGKDANGGRYDERSYTASATTDAAGLWSVSKRPAPGPLTWTIYTEATVRNASGTVLATSPESVVQCTIWG